MVPTTSAKLRMLGHRSNAVRKLSSKITDDAEKRRRERLIDIYSGPFSGLVGDERKDLGLSGRIWWEHSQIESRPRKVIGIDVLRMRQKLDMDKAKVFSNDTLQDPSSPTWMAFRLAMTHNSTAIEGNKLTKGETETVLDELADGVGNLWGISE
jgi:hypothetical protein